MEDLNYIEKHGKQAQGKKELLNYLRTGKRLTPTQAIKAQCYCCGNFYLDGKIDCQMTDCPLYTFMPYRKDKPAMETQERTKKQIANDRRLSLIRTEANKTKGASNRTNAR